MDTELIEYLKDYLSKNDIDGLIVNSTNEFLVEYNLLEYNSRYHLTGFSGSTGDVLFTADKIYLFVDTRYHEQASNQVDENIIDVVKIPLEKTYLNALLEIVPPYFKLGMVSKKTSKKFFDLLLNNLQKKNSTIKLLNTDPVYDYKKDSISQISYNVFAVDKSITGQSADEKFEMVKSFAGDKFDILVTSLEDIAYLTNLRSYDFEYTSVFPAKALINQDGVKIYSDCNLPFIGEKYKALPMSEFENDIKQIERSDVFIDDAQLTINDYKLINPSNKILQSHLNLFKTVKLNI